jgi:hypothetical protein
MGQERDPLIVGTPIPRSNVVTGTGPMNIKPANEQQDVQRQGEYKEPVVVESEIEDRTSKKARLAAILDRSVVGDRFRVPLPAHLHGEWMRNDPSDIARAQALGFKIDNEHAPKRALHGDGTGSAIVGDVIHMTCLKETKELIDEIRQEQFFARNAKPGEKKVLGEEKAFMNATKNDTGGIIPTFTESTVQNPRLQDIRDAVNAVDNQTQTQP